MSEEGTKINMKQVRIKICVRCCHACHW